MKKIFLVLILLLNTALFTAANESTDLAFSENDKSKISLEEAMEKALIGNIELQEERKNLGISKNDIKIANALRNPSFQSNILMGQVAKSNASQAGIVLPIEILKRSARKKAALAELSYTENKINDYEFKLKLRIRTAYFNLLLAKSDLKIMEERKELLEDLYDIAKNKPKNTESYKIDVLQADMRIKKQIIQINKSRANVRTAQYNFNRILNLENNLSLYDTREESVFDKTLVSEINVPDYSVLETAAFKNRYDIKMAESKMLKNKREIDIAVRKRIPDLYLGGGYSFISARDTNSGGNGAYMGVGFEIPSLYLYTPEIKNAKLNYDKAQLEYNSIINITKNIIHTNHDKFVISKENVFHYNSILDESNEILKISKERYKKGKIPITSLIVIEHNHQELLNEYVSAIGVYYNAYIALLEEIGSDNFASVSDL